MKKIVLLSLFVITVGSSYSQNVSINDSGAVAHASAALDVSSTSKGLLTPRLTTAQRIAVASPATGLLVYDTDLKGFYYYDGAVWVAVSATASSLFEVNNDEATPKIVLAGNSESKQTDVVIGDELYPHSALKPVANLSIYSKKKYNLEGKDYSNALALGAGNPSYNAGGSQILMGFLNNPANTRNGMFHAIKTRHAASGGSDGDNSMEFFMYTMGTPGSKPPTKKVMVINGLGRVGINHYNSSSAPGTIPNPHSNLQVNGSFAAAVITATGALTLTEQHYFVVCGAGSSITLPAVSSAYSVGEMTGDASGSPESRANGFSASSRIYVLSNITNSPITISSYTLPDGTTATSIPAGSNLQLMNDGTVWRKIN